MRNNINKNQPIYVVKSFIVEMSALTDNKEFFDINKQIENAKMLGFYYSFEQAENAILRNFHDTENAILHNFHDILESDYEDIIIEKREEGLSPFPLSRWFYGFDIATGKVKKSPEPVVCMRFNGLIGE